MGLIQSWLGYRNEFPRKLRLGVCRYFKELLTQKTAMDNTAILNDLSPAFRHGGCRYIQHEVRHNPLFSDIPARALAYLVPIKQLRSVAAKEHIGDVGNPGTSVYVVANGIVSLREDCDMADIRVLCAGDSFGQEALLGKERQYQYPLVAKEKVTLKVVHMLEGRSAKAKKYKTDEKLSYAPFSTWCANVQETLKKQITKSTKEIETRSAYLGKLETDITTLGDEIATLHTDLAP